MSVGNKLQEFWFQSVDARVYELMRIGFAIAAIVNILLWWPSAIDLLSNQGLHASDPIGPSIFYHVNSPFAVVAIMLIALAAHIMILLGVRPRLFLVISFLWHLSYFNYSRTGSAGMDFVLGNFCFILLVSPLGKALNSKTFRRVASLPAYGVFLLRFQVCVIYWSTVLKRTSDSYWQNGDFLGYFLLSEYSICPGLWVLDALPFLRILTWGAILIELAIPLLLLFKKTWKLGLLIGIVFHLMIAIIAPQILGFSLVCLALFTAFVRFGSDEKGKLK